MLHRESLSLFSKTHKSHRIKLCGQNVEFFNVKTLKDILEGFQTGSGLGSLNVGVDRANIAATPADSA